MNNKIKIGIVAALIFIGAAFSEVTGIKFPVGGTVLHDSSAAIFTINKNVYIGGQARVSSIRFKDFNSMITEGLSEMILNSPAYNFQTLTEEPVMTLDSTNGLYLFYGNAQVDGFTRLGSGAPTVKQKLITGVLPSTTGGFPNFAHGLSNHSKITGIQLTIMDDSLRRGLFPGYNASAGLTVGNIYYTSTSNITYYLQPGSLNLVNDTIRFLITYTN